MKPSGWLFLGLSWTFILWLCGFCFGRLLRRGRGGHARR